MVWPRRLAGNQNAELQRIVVWNGFYEGVRDGLTASPPPTAQQLIGRNLEGGRGLRTQMTGADWIIG